MWAVIVAAGPMISVGLAAAALVAQRFADGDVLDLLHREVARASYVPPSMQFALKLLPAFSKLGRQQPIATDGCYRHLCLTHDRARFGRVQ